MGDKIFDTSESINILDSVHKINSKRCVSSSRMMSNFLLNPLDRRKLSEVINSLSTLDSISFLKSWLITLEDPVNVEILWMLNKKHVLQITTYLHLYEKFHEQFISDLYQLATVTSCLEKAHQILSDVLLLLISVTSLSLLYQLCQQILNKFVDKIVESLFSENPVTIYNYLKNLCASKSSLKLEAEIFCSSHLLKLLCFPTDKASLQQVISQQIIWTQRRKISPSLNEFFLYILKPLKYDEVLEKIFSVIKNEDYNLWNILSIISPMCENFGDKSLSGALDEIFLESIRERNEDWIYLVLLLIRQVFLHDLDSFHKEYAKWFKNLRLNNAQSKFLFQCLDKIVPVEPSLFLKIHVNEFPSVPCRSALTDYINLVRTRLLDLNETSEYLGIFHLTDEDGQKADLSMILTHFKQTGEIMKPVIEASVFRRQYFNNVFLAYLLSSKSGDIEGKRSFVDRLNKQGLIPSNRYSAWKESCSSQDTG